MKTAESPDKQALALMGSAGLRRTTARMRVLAMLINSHEPLTVQQLHEGLSDLQVDTVTVYRTLRTLVEKSLARQIDLGDRTYRYEGVALHPLHAHFICRLCGSVRCLKQKIEGPSHADVLKELGRGAVLESQQVLYQGTCAKCKR